MWVETLPNANSSFQNLTIDISCEKKHAKLDTVIGYIFILSNFTVFPYFVPKICCGLWNQNPNQNLN